MVHPLFFAATALFAAPRMPPLEPTSPPATANEDNAAHRPHFASTSDYGVRKNHPTSYDDNPPFKGPLSLEEKESPDMHRRRIRGYYLADELLQSSLQSDNDATIADDDGRGTKFVSGLPKLGPSSSTSTILKTIVDHLARSDAPVDVKEVAESSEFYLRSGKRLLGAAKRVLKNNSGVKDQNEGEIQIHDLCSGHGLTGMLFVACNPPRPPLFQSIRTILVDQSEPRSHSILRDCISEICPWVSKDSVTFVSSPLQNYVSHGLKEKDAGTDAYDASIVISTHACGSLTDQVLKYAVDSQAASLAVMPCCYTGTDAGAPYGVRRLLGVALSADVRRSWYLQENDYHVDFAAIPKAITPMNRIVVAERRS